MICPKCKAEMIEGTLELRAYGLWGIPQALLRFNKELILKDQYIPFVGLFKRRGAKTTAFRCERCSIISFQPSEQ